MRAKELLHKIKSARGRMIRLALIEADRREAKLETIAEIRRRFASPEGHAWGTNGVLDNMTDELEGRPPRFAIRSGAEPDAE